MLFKHSKLLLVIGWTLFVLVCLAVVASIFIGLSDGFRTQATEQARSSTPIMDCNPEYASCPSDQQPQVDEFTDVILPTSAIMAGLGAVVTIACVYRPKPTK